MISPSLRRSCSVLWLLPGLLGLGAGCATTQAVERGELENLRRQVSELKRQNRSQRERMQRLDDRLVIVAARLEQLGGKGQSAAAAMHDEAPMQVVRLSPEPAPEPKPAPRRRSRGPDFREPSAQELDEVFNPPPRPAPAAPAAAPEPPKARATAPAPAEEPEGKSWLRDYEAGLRAFHAGDMGAARRLMASFHAEHRATSYGDNAVYWIGEAYLIDRELALAEGEFRRVLVEYPSSNKVPDALFKISEIREAQGQLDQAKALLEQVLREHPRTEVAGKARARLDALRPKLGALTTGAGDKPDVSPGAAAPPIR